jgi:hypothetical protein
LRPLTLWLWGSLLGMAAGGCTSDLVLSLEGKRCDSRRQCVGGFVCDERSNSCVRPAELAAGDAGPGLGGAGSGGELGGGAGGASAGVPGGSGAGAGQGSGGSSPVGAGGSVLAPGGDAGSDPTPLPDGGCAGRIYRDADEDGVGNTSSYIDGACPESGWVSQPGDCRDDLEDVFPGQTEHFAVPFDDPLAPEDISFDYDCSGSEDPDPSNSTLDQPPAGCAGLGGALDCAGSGFLPLVPARAGNGVEPRCGSTLVRDCFDPAGLALCASRDTPIAVETAFRCK